MKINFSTDSDGYLSQECPSYAQRFKVCFGEGSEESISFCPYCGKKGHDCLVYTRSSRIYPSCGYCGVVLSPELKKLEREMEKASGGFLKIDMKADLPQVGAPPMETDDALDILSNGVIMLAVNGLCDNRFYEQAIKNTISGRMAPCNEQGAKGGIRL